ncbi:hypothetical protein K1T73_10825 [Roseovarius sp. SCSIO 43702]|nr:hypothetical protein K1T73_10825 [Roseovarius sp. SCSIO 43702]
MILALPAAAQEPLSAIGWLDEAARVPVAPPRVAPDAEAPVAEGVTVPEITVMALDDVRRDAVGLLAGDVTGLPPTLWTASQEAKLEALWERATAEPLPAVQALYYTLLLAEAEPPAGDDGSFLRTRIDALIRFGAIEPAYALLERAGPETPELFGRWLDLSLLTGNEEAACRTLSKNPELLMDFAARIYCHARAGDWQTAALLYDGAHAIGMLDKTEDLLLAQFLDPELIHDAVTLAPPSEPSPLIFQLYEAAGTPLPTRNLPRAFANADLRNTSGWKAEIEAAERLVRTGALSENRLLGLYTDRDPAASGGIWDRVAAIQALDRAVEDEDATAVAQTLPRAWTHMRRIDLEVAFARLYDERLAALDLPDHARTLAWRIRLLSDNYERAAEDAPEDADAQFLASIARGRPDPDAAPSPLARHIAGAFTRPSRPAPRHDTALRDGKLGEAILSAATLLDRAGPEDYDEIADALTTLRAVGLEDTARRAALELLILGARE